MTASQMSNSRIISDSSGLTRTRVPSRLTKNSILKRLGKKSFDALNEKTEAEMTGRKIFVYVQ
jgi:hypothetical protein